MIRHPVVTGYPRLEAERLIFDSPRVEIVIAGDIGVLDAALRRCDGTHTLSEVVSVAPPDARSDLLAALDDLATRGVIVDRSRTFTRTHRDGALPDPTLTEDTVAAPPHAWRPQHRDRSVATRPASRGRLQQLLGARASAAAGQFTGALSAAQLGAIAWAAYGATRQGRRTAPSAGALAPLSVHVACLGGGPLEAGIWWFDGEHDCFYPHETSPASLRQSFLTGGWTEEIVARCAAVLVVCADTERAAAVYGNRSYRYVCMEAGAATQNALLAAAAEGVAARLLGGFDDAAAAAMLGTPAHVLPLLGVALG